MSHPAFAGGLQCKQGPRSGLLCSRFIIFSRRLPWTLLPVCHSFCWISTCFSVVLWLKRGCFSSSFSIDLCFLLRMSSPSVSLLGCTKARFLTMNAEYSFLVPALNLMRISHWKFCSLGPRCSLSTALFMRPNSFYGIKPAFASGYVAWAADGKDT